MGATETKTNGSSYLYQQCSAIALYAICYSVIKLCSYWDLNTVAAVVHCGILQYDNIGMNTNFSSVNLPHKVKICGTEVNVTLKAHYRGTLSTTDSNYKSVFESLIRYSDENTGFLIWLAGYCISCIF